MNLADVTCDGVLRMGLNDYRGLSAYEIAVQNGFEGSEEEWLASLKGEPGKSADTITVNRKRAVDGNISVNGTDINLRPGEPKTVTQAYDEISKQQTSGLTSEDIVNDLTTGGSSKILSAEMGALLQHTKPEVFWAEVEIPIGDWEGDGPYTRDISLSGVLADSNSCAVYYTPKLEYEEAFISHNLRVIAQKDDTITVRVDEIPETVFTFNVYVTILRTREAAQ